MQIDSMFMDLPYITANSNNVKDLILSRLFKDKIISEESLKEYKEKWQIIVIKPSWFKIWKNIFNKDNDEYIFKLVKFED